MTALPVAQPSPEDHLPVLLHRLRPQDQSPLAQQVVTTALHALVASGKSTASCRAVERFVAPGSGANVVTRLLVVTDIHITLS